MFTIRRLGPEDAEVYRTVRLEGLQLHPASFGAAWAEEQTRPASWFAALLQDGLVLGGWVDLELMGVAGLRTGGPANARHKGVLWGMYVREAARGTGLAAALVAHVAAAGQGVVEELRLTVVADNLAAVRLYEAAGFVRYAVEPRGLKVAGVYHDEALMALRFPQG